MVIHVFIYFGVMLQVVLVVKYCETEVELMHCSTFKQECPVKVRFGLSSDGQHLVLIELNENHNHAVTQASFVHLPRQRKLDDDEKTEATMLMDMKINKQVIQEHLQVCPLVLYFASLQLSILIKHTLVMAIIMCVFFFLLCTVIS